MKRTLYSALICALIVGVSIPLLQDSVSAAGIAIFVDDDFPDTEEYQDQHMWNTIQQGIDDATNGNYDTVYVLEGTYNENVVVNKSTLTVQGESSSLVTVDGQGSGYTFEVIAWDVTLRQLKIIGGAPAGIYWGSVANGVIEKCDITDNAIGIALQSLVNQTIQCNQIHNNTGDGIEVRASELKDLTMNTIYSNYDGISLYDSTRITIWYNKSYSNSRYGIYADSSSDNNDIYLNDFFGNTAGDGYQEAGADNNWETPNQAAWLPYCYGGVSYSSFRGNYWGDYGGIDVFPLDGIGDTPYPLGSEADSYPLISIYADYPMGTTCPGTPVPECEDEVAPPSPPFEPGPGGCFIATAAYGTESVAEIDVLRAFRDEVLLESTVGSQLVEWYYQTSPPVADFIAENAVLKTLVRELVVDPIASLVEATGSLWRD